MSVLGLLVEEAVALGRAVRPAPLLREVVAAAETVWHWPAGVAARHRPLPLVPPGTRVVVCVHGYGATKTNFFKVAAALRTAGCRTVSFSYSPFVETPGRIVRRLGELVEHAARSAAGGTVALVGHSMGGVLARRVAASHPGLVDTVLTVASPHGGAPIAAAVGMMRPEVPPVRCAKALAPAAPGLDGRVPASVRKVAVRAGADAVVPPDRARWQDPDATNMLVGGVGHLAVMFDERVAALAVKVCAPDPEVAPAAAAA